MSQEFSATLASGNVVRATTYSIVISDPNGTVLKTIDVARIRDVTREGDNLTIETVDNDRTSLRFASIDAAAMFQNDVATIVPTAKDRTGGASGTPRAADGTVQQAISSILMPNEAVLAIAPQDPKAPAVRKAAAIATSHRLIFYRPGLTAGSFNFDDIRWQDIQDTQLRQGMLFADLIVRRTNGQVLSVDKLEKAAARSLYTIAQQQEHEWHERRRQRQMEEDRARSGGVIVHAGPAMATPPVPAPTAAAQVKEDPVERLSKLKRMLDAGLIEQSEYESTKARILAEL